MKLLKLLILTAVIPFLLNSCGAMEAGKYQEKITVENGSIPPDLGKDDSIIICVLTGRNSRDKYMKKHITENYQGNYEFVLQSDLTSDKYNDTDLYRYLLDYEASTTKTTRTDNKTGRTSFVDVPVSKYYIKDRKSNEIYSSNIKSGHFARLIEAYSINMEKVRSANN